MAAETQDAVVSRRGTEKSGSRRGPAGDDELYLDEILALTPIRRTRLYTLRDRGRFGAVREARGPTCPRPVFRLSGVAEVCRELGYPVPTREDLRRHRSAGGAANDVADGGAGDEAPTARSEVAAVGDRGEAIRELEVQRDRARERQAAVEVALEVVEAARDRALADLAARDAAVAAVEDQLEAGGRELDRLRRELETGARIHAAEQGRLEDRVETLGSERDALRLEHDRIRDERDTARSEREAVRLRLTGVEADLRIAEAAREQAQDDRRGTEAGRRRLESDLEERTAELHRVESDLRGAQVDAQRAKADLDEARSGREEVREALASAREENSSLRPQVEVLRANTTRAFRRRERRAARRAARAKVPAGQDGQVGEDPDA